MASGSYARKPSQQLVLEEGVNKQIPPRATRQLRAAKESITEDYDYVPGIAPVAAPDRSFQDTPYPKTRSKQPLSPRPQLAASTSGTSVRQAGINTRSWNKPYQDNKLNSYWLKPWFLCLIGAICFLAVLISAGMFQRSNSSFISSDGQAYDIQVGGNQAGTWQQNHPVAPKTNIVPQSGPYVVLNKPSITVDFINKVLSNYNSPASGKGQSLYDLGAQYNIDPAFALAFFMHESSFGTKGEATKSLSLGNLRCIPNFRCEDNFAQFNTWEDGFKAWYELIRNWYVAVKGLTTVDQIIPVYAPPSDNNNDDAYIGSLKHALDTWHAGQIIVT